MPRPARIASRIAWVPAIGSPASFARAACGGSCRRHPRAAAAAAAARSRSGAPRGACPPRLDQTLPCSCSLGDALPARAVLRIHHAYAVSFEKLVAELVAAREVLGA